jgi:hypothetical protein
MREDFPGTGPVLELVDSNSLVRWKKVLGF